MRKIFHLFFFGGDGFFQFLVLFKPKNGGFVFLIKLMLVVDGQSGSRGSKQGEKYDCVGNQVSKPFRDI